MLLNAVSGDVDVPGLAERLARKGKRLAGLEKRGWVDQAGDGTWSLTDEGRAAKERIGAIVDGIRARVAGAVSPEDFATTMASLEAIARELGWSEETAGHRERRGFGRGFGPRVAGSASADPGSATAILGSVPGSGAGSVPSSTRVSIRVRGTAADTIMVTGTPSTTAAEAITAGITAAAVTSASTRERRHDAEHAYERGFDAGYTRGASERD